MQRRLIVGVGGAVGVGKCRRPMRLLSCGFWLRSIHPGRIHSGSPLTLMRQFEPFSLKWVW